MCLLLNLSCTPPLSGSPLTAHFDPSGTPFICVTYVALWNSLNMGGNVGKIFAHRSALSDDFQAFNLTLSFELQYSIRLWNVCILKKYLHYICRMHGLKCVSMVSIHFV